MRELFAGRCWIAVELHLGADDARRLARLRELGARTWLAAGRRRRRPHALARAARAAGYAYCHPPSLHAGCSGSSPVSQRRAPSAFLRAAGADLSARAARGNAAHRATLRVLAALAALSLSARAGPARPGRLAASAQPDRSGIESALAERRAGEDSRSGREGARADQAAAVRAFLPHRARDRAVGARPAEADPVPGPRLGRQFGRVLRPAHHRSRPGQHRCAVRALHQRGAQRAARHRCRLRARTTRGSHPARLREVRTRARGAGRDRHHLSAEERDSRRRQGARARRRT